MKTSLATDTASVQTLVFAKQVAQIPTNCYIPHPFPGTCPKELLQGAPNCSSPWAQQQTARHSPAPRSHLEGTLCIHHSKVVFPPSSHKRWKVHLFRNRLQWALAYLGKLPIHHRQVEFSRHECLFYEHLHSMNAQSKKFISVRIVHMGNTLHLQGKKHEMQNSTKPKPALVQDHTTSSSKIHRRMSIATPPLTTSLQ